MVIDAHHHLWKYNAAEYGWIGDSMDILRRDYLPDELQKELEGSGVTATVVVQARQTIEETSWLLDLAERTPWIRGVVGWLDLRAPGLQGQLEQFGSHPKLVGVRHVIQDEPDPEFMLKPEFVRGIAMLQAYDLAYDLLLFPGQLDAAVHLAEMFPDQRFVLDHLGKPPIREGRLEPWKTALESLAGHGNVWCKLSGMVTEADHLAWTYEGLLPFMDSAYQAFGADRVMCGSDWPVCRLAASYGEAMEVPIRFANGLTGRDCDRLLFRNAAELYRLNS